MHPSCFVCNARVGIAGHNEVNIFSDEIKLQSGKQLKDVLGEIFDKPVHEETAHSKVICKKCHKSVTEYDSIQVRLKVIQLDMLKNFKATLNRRHIDYETYNKRTVVKSVTPLSDRVSERKKVVLPASKLQPVPPDFVLRPGNWFSAATSVASSKSIVTIPTSSSTLNLKVTVGSSVLTQSVKTTNASNKIMLSTNTPKQNYILTQASNDESNNTSSDFSIDPNLLQMESPIFTSSNPISFANNISTVLTKTNNSILSFNVNSLPKDFLASGVLGKVNVDDLVTIEVDMKKEIDGGDLEAIDDQAMEIDEDCAVAVAAANDKEGMTFTKNNDQSESDKTKDFLETLLPGLTNESANDDEIGNKYIVGKLEILNDRGDVDEEEGEAIVMNGENGSIIRIVSGQKFLYGDSEISIVMPEDSQDGENNDGGDGQDSNDESQIELQVSGDEETANAIIAAAQEQGGAFIKVESGEMYRVKSVQSKNTEQESSEVDTVAAVNTMVSQEEDGQFKCLLCKNNKREGDPFVGSAEATMQHLKAAHGARAYLCPQCGRTLRKRCELAAHIEEHAMKSHKGLRPADRSKAHECSVCNKKYSSRTLLMAHMNLHSGTKPYTCDICHKSFASKYTHQSHLKIHEDRPRPYKCKQCNKTFFTQPNLNQHEKTHTGIKDFVCNVCGKAFASQHNLEVHGVVHSGSKPFKCGACGKAFARRAEVRDHMRIHTGERPFKCDICGASFTQRSNLHSHKRATHLDDKRYHCEQCPKRFKRRRLLDYHVKATHTGERPLKCEICKSTFVYPEHYKKHIRIHSGEKPYVCEVCGKSFNSRDNRNTHRFVHSDRKPYECLVCGAGYMRKQQLYHHMNTSGHLVESIVVNQPRVLKVPAKNTEATQAMVVESASDKESEYSETIYETTGDVLQLQTNNGKAMESTDLDHTPKLFITEDKKLIIQDHQGAKSINFVQDNDEPALLTLQNIDPSLKTDGTLLETITAEQSEQAQLITTDGSGGTFRLVQIQLPDGNNGWLTINQ